MDITDIENLKFIIPIMGVIGLGSFIFLFGFKHSVTPPSFEDLIDLDNKKSKKKKTKYDKLKIANPKPKDLPTKKSVAPVKSKKDEVSSTNPDKDNKKVLDKKEKIVKGKDDLKGKKPSDHEKSSTAMEGWMTIPPRKDKKVVAPVTKGAKQHAGMDEGRSSTSPEFMSHSESSDHVQELQRGKSGNQKQDVVNDKKKNVATKGKDKVKQGKDGTASPIKGKSADKAMAYDDLDAEAGNYYDYDGYNDDQSQYVTQHTSPPDHTIARGPVTKIAHADTFAMDTNHPPAKPGLNKGQPNINYPSFSSSGSSATSSRDTIANEWELVNHPTLVDGNALKTPREHDAMVHNIPPPVAVKPILKLTPEEDWMGLEHSPLQPVAPYFGSSLSVGNTPSILIDHGSDAWLNNYSSYMTGDLLSTGGRDKSPVERALLEEIKRKRDVLRDRIPEAFTFEDDHPSSETGHGASKQQHQAAREISSSVVAGGKQPYYQPDALSPDEAVRGILPEAYGGPKKIPKKKALQNGVGYQDNTPAEPGANGEVGNVKKAVKKKKKKPNSTTAPSDGGIVA